MRALLSPTSTAALLLALTSAAALSACQPKIEQKQLQSVIAENISKQLNLSEDAAKTVEVSCPEKIAGDQGGEITCRVLIPLAEARRAQAIAKAIAACAPNQCRSKALGETIQAELEANWTARATPIMASPAHPFERLQRLGGVQRQRAEVKVKVTDRGKVSWTLHDISATASVTSAPSPQ